MCNILGWIKDYLTQRQQRVTLEGFSSTNKILDVGYLRGQYWDLSCSYYTSMISPMVFLTIFDYLLMTLPCLLSSIMTL